MHSDSGIAAVVAITLAAAWLAQALLGRMSGGRGAPGADPNATVAARAVMSGNELDFFRTLKAALPDAIVLAQVSFGALIEPKGVTPGTSAFWANRNRFGQKVADYVILDADGKVVAVVELDDRTHDRGRDRIRDALLASAGIAVVRYESKAKPGPAAIRQDLHLPARPRTGLLWG